MINSILLLLLFRAVLAALEDLREERHFEMETRQTMAGRGVRPHIPRPMRSLSNSKLRYKCENWQIEPLRLKEWYRRGG